MQSVREVYMSDESWPNRPHWAHRLIATTDYD